MDDKVDIWKKSFWKPIVGHFCLKNFNTHIGPIPCVAEIFVELTTFGYAQMWWATVNHFQSGYGPNANDHKNCSKKNMFSATSGILNESKLQNIT